MAILQSALTVILKAYAWLSTSNASQYAMEALASLMNLILKVAGNFGIGEK